MNGLHLSPAANGWHFGTWLRDTFERAASSFVQAIVVYTLTVSVAWDASTWKALTMAGTQAAAAVVLAALSTAFPKPTSWLADAVWRVVRTFVGTILAALAAGFDLFSGDAWRALVLSALMAAAAILKALMVRADETPGTTPASWASAPS